MELKYHKKIYSKKGSKAQWRLFLPGGVVLWMRTMIITSSTYSNADESRQDSIADEFGNFALHGSIRG
jgi:hypothetical protein